MHVCCLVWEIPMIEGEHYTPILYAMYAGKAKKFLKALNAYFENAHMDWKCVLDSSACTYNEIFRVSIRLLFLSLKPRQDNGRIQKICNLQMFQNII